MTTTEDDLRAVLASRAAELPAGVIDRLRHYDYRPWTGRFPVGAKLGVAGGTGAAVAAGMVLASAPPAFAGWTPTAAPASRAELAAANATCASPLAQLVASSSALIPVVTDVQGPFTLIVDKVGSLEVTCLTGQGLTEVSVQGAGGHGAASSGETQGSSATPSYRVSAGAPIAGYEIGHLGSLTVTREDSSEGSYMVLVGEVAPSVSGVLLVRSDGTDVQTSLESGMLVAWWPGSDTARSVQLTTASGTTTVPLVSVAVGAGRCAAGTSATGVSGSSTGGCPTGSTP